MALPLPLARGDALALLALALALAPRETVGKEEALPLGVRVGSLGVGVGTGPLGEPEGVALPQREALRGALAVARARLPLG